MDGVKIGGSPAARVKVEPDRNPGAAPAAIRRRRRRRIIRILLIWPPAIALVAGVVWLVFSSGAFAVHQVQVEGTARFLTRDEILGVAKVPMGLPLARLDTAAIEQRVKAIRQVESVVVERAWPQDVRIVVKERRPVAVTASGDLLDRFGVTVETAKKARIHRLELPRLAVPRPGRNDPATRAGLSVLSALPSKIESRLIEIDVPTPEGVTLRLNGDVRIIWGSADRSEEKARIAATLMKQRAKVYDVSSPEVVTVR